MGIVKINKREHEIFKRVCKSEPRHHIARKTIGFNIFKSQLLLRDNVLSEEEQSIVLNLLSRIDGKDLDGDIVLLAVDFEKNVSTISYISEVVAEYKED